jgi:hypothetical protein
MTDSRNYIVKKEIKLLRHKRKMNMPHRKMFSYFRKDRNDIVAIFEKTPLK